MWGCRGWGLYSIPRGVSCTLRWLFFVLDAFGSAEFGELIECRLRISIHLKVEVPEDILWFQCQQLLTGKHGRRLRRVASEIAMVFVGK